MEFGFLREETAEVGLHGYVELLVVVETAFVEALVNSAEACSLNVCAKVDGRHVGDRQRGIGFSGPAAVFVEVGDFKLVDPYDSVFAR